MTKRKKLNDSSPAPLQFKGVLNFPDYHVRSDGKVFKNMPQGCATFSKRITPHRVNRHDKQLSVFLFRDGRKKAVPLRYIVLTAFYGQREQKCYKAEFIDGNPDNCSAGNLRWVLRKNVSFFEILTDREFEVYNEAIRRIKFVSEIRKRNEVWLQKFIAWLRKNHTASADARYEFFKNLFKQE